MRIKVKNVIFTSLEINSRAGGPSGYIANLKQGLEGNSMGEGVVVISKEKDNKHLKNKLRLKRFLSCWVPIPKLRREFRSWLINKDVTTSEFSVSLQSLYYKELLSELDRYDFESITCHWIRDALVIRKYLDSRNSKAKLILMSHSPQPASEEAYIIDKLSDDPNAEKNYKKRQKMEYDAFNSAADYLLFPSREAMEPYEKGLEYFEQLKQRKNFIFLPTGCCKLHTDNTKEKLRRIYKIKTPFVICYIGRHNKIKGYDILKSIAWEILKIREDITFLIGGLPSKEIAPLDNERWIELGFVNPADVFQVSDCFILPNRQTYFDLVLLEAMSMGCPVFASATGGNKSVSIQTGAISLYATKEECINKVLSFIDLSSSDKEIQRDKIKKAYEQNYTVDVFAKKYIETISSL